MPTSSAWGASWRWLSSPTFFGATGWGDGTDIVDASGSGVSIDFSDAEQSTLGCPVGQSP